MRIHQTPTGAGVNLVYNHSRSQLSLQKTESEKKVTLYKELLNSGHCATKVGEQNISCVSV